MATDTLIPVIGIVLLFVSCGTSSGTSLSCDGTQLCIEDTGSGWDGHCTLNSSYVIQCCHSMPDDNFTMKFSGESSLDTGISELMIANMTFENCAKPIVIEDMMSVEIRNVTFR